MAYDKTDLYHLSFDRQELLFVEECHDVARMGEVDLGGAQRRREHSLVTLRRHIRQRDRKQRAARAIANGVNLLLVGHSADDFEGLERALADIVSESLTGEFRVRVNPGDNENS